MEHSDILNKTLSGGETKIDSCQKHGNYESTFYKFGKLESWSGCPKCAKEKEAKDTEEQYRIMQENRLSNALKRSCIPPRFRGKTFETYVADTEQRARALKTCQEFSSRFDELKNDAPSLILCGRPGTGKTHLACAIADSLIRNGKTAIFARVFDAIRFIKGTWQRDSEMTEREAIRTFIEPDLLILDEVGVQFGSESEMLLVFEIINGRYEAIKPTVLISNLPVVELKNFIGERVMDRLREGGGKYIAFDWDSYRGKI